MEFLANRCVIIGLGLIGSSLSASLKQQGAFRTIVGVDLNPVSGEWALNHHIVDEFTSVLSQACQDADVVVIATPVLSMEPVLRELAPILLQHPPKLLTDVGSAKAFLATAAEQIFGQLPDWFVPGHPIAGSEKHGVTACQPGLFNGHKVILTPTAQSSSQAINLAKAIWIAVGADVHLMSLQRHDAVLAATSHLPHLLAFALVDTLASSDESQEIFNYAAGGFRDFTRIAASDPTMWHDIFIVNKHAVLSALDDYSQHLAYLRKLILAEQSIPLKGVFTRAKVAREHFDKLIHKSPYITIMSKSITYQCHSSSALQGHIKVPGDKSISHRSIMLGALAKGTTNIEGFLEGEDSLATLQAFRDMGVIIEGPTDGKVVIHGVGLDGLSEPPGPLYLGNSGTAMRLFVGLLAGQRFDVTLTGDESLSKRPMGRVVNPLVSMGAQITAAEGGRPPLAIKGSCRLTGIDYVLPMASAQVKSCLLLAGLYADSEVKVQEPAPTRDHTERMFKAFGIELTSEAGVVTLPAQQALKATNIIVPSDISSAAFFLVAASINPGSELVLEGVGMNPTRTGVIDILRLMGAEIHIEQERLVGGEPIADIRVIAQPLKGINIPEHLVPLAIDEFPVLFVAAACADGVTRLTGAEELRVKESDRIQVMADGLQALGVSATPTPDGIEILGGPIQGGVVDSHGDHRIAMAFSVAASQANALVEIKDCANVATSFPGFVELARSVGLSIDVQE